MEKPSASPYEAFADSRNVGHQSAHSRCLTHMYHMHCIVISQWWVGSLRQSLLYQSA